MFRALDQYIYYLKDDTVYVNLFIGSVLDYQSPYGHIALDMSTDYPWNNTVTFKISDTNTASFNLKVRIPK